jgi:hypothetical protein
MNPLCTFEHSKTDPLLTFRDTKGPVINQGQGYFGRFRRRCVKVQAVVTADGQCIQLSEPFRGSAHGKAIISQSKVMEFFAVRGAAWLEESRLAIVALGYLAVQRSGRYERSSEFRGDL